MQRTNWFSAGLHVFISLVLLGSASGGMSEVPLSARAQANPAPGGGAALGSAQAAPAAPHTTAVYMAIAAGNNHTCGLTTVGGVKCWGDNTQGQLGNGTTSGSSTPVDVLGLSGGITALAAGGDHTCALRANGHVLCWGANGSGELGDGTTIQSSTPVTSTYPFSNTLAASAIALGSVHTCAVLAGNMLTCWGSNQSGQLGDGTIQDKSHGVTVINTGASAVSAGFNHTCAVLAGGAVKCWGADDKGQVGDGAFAAKRLQPTAVSGLSSGVLAVAAGYLFSCALTSSHGVKCWGYDRDGQLGDGFTQTENTPGDVAGLTGGANQVSSGGGHACALLVSGGVRCWGVNSFGQIGDGTTTNRSVPADVAGLGGAVSALAAGKAHTCALLVDGKVMCWGDSARGQLGDGRAPQQSVLVNVVGETGGVTELAAGGYHTCALAGGVIVKCWGYNDHGQLGDGSLALRSTPVSVVGLPITSTITALTTGNKFSCVLIGHSRVKCWGENDNGELGDGNLADSGSPQDVLGLTGPITITTVSAGANYACALLADGGVKCWGRNYEGQLGDGSNTRRTSAVAVSGLGGKAIAIAPGYWHTCVLMEDGSIKCWGDNLYGELGNGLSGPGQSSNTPLSVAGLSGRMTAIVSQNDTSCALSALGGVWCWGRNDAGQVGDGTFFNRSLPAPAAGLSKGVSSLAAGGWNTCALTLEHSLQCWGDDKYSQLGDPALTSHSTPQAIPGFNSGVIQVTVGGHHICALVTRIGAQCLGWDGLGQLGDGRDGSAVQSAAPVDVQNLAQAVSQIAVGDGHACEILADGSAKCWGDNSYSQLGSGGITPTLYSPTQVVGLASGVTMISPATYHTCAVVSGSARCWGGNVMGALGTGLTSNEPVPATVSGMAASVTGISALGEDTCAVWNGGVKCWGYDSFFPTQPRLTPQEVGIARDAAAVSGFNALLSGGGVKSVHFGSTPADVPGLTSGVTALSAGLHHACVLVGGGGVKCWGNNTYGELGNGQTDLSQVTNPVNVIGLSGPALAVASGANHTCALLSGGRVMCWGKNDKGQLGDGSFRNSSTPVQVAGLTAGASAVAAGSESTCALVGAGKPVCWGSDESGQLGDGAGLKHPIPYYVVDTPLPTLVVAYPNAGAGSLIPVTGISFPPNSQATVIVNLRLITATLPVSSSGSFFFFLHIHQATPKPYTIRVIVPPVAADAGRGLSAAALNISADAQVLVTDTLPTRPAEGGGLTFDIPLAAVYSHAVYLPLVNR